ncbi:ATP-dependent DNA ligase [Sutcliffiella horikoshii]|uniref:ATP-dependent DNA ligase n=1 Tax=Sutcliffiella horikoshii TaxID=79883 RepID=UPI002040932F|nr:RNA ligase family protein [Sutcliffiella horikoshii]MCM3619694.1 ATP-dependent DNA ligase [Sutcliffiella horikoshii]
MFIQPMLLDKSNEPFNDDNFITELKLDGFRLLLSKFEHKVKLYTRHGNEVTSLFKNLISIDIPDGTILDGEFIVPGKNGAPDFEATMEVFRSLKSTHFYQFCIFDIIYLNHEKVAQKPLWERKELLNSLAIEHEHIVVSKWMYGHGIEYFKLTQEQGLEGIVLKEKNSPYEHKRSKHWIKVINYQYDFVDIVGLRKEEFGWLLAFKEGRPAGIMEFVPPKEKQVLHSDKRVRNEDHKYIYIEPVPCWVKYRNLTKNNMLRIPSFHSWN